MLRNIRNNNAICCDQSLRILSATEIDQPATIIGSTPSLEDINIEGTNLQYFIRYQWQRQTLNSTNKNWLNINDATSKDFLPPSLKIIHNTRRGTLEPEENYNYRRISTINYQSIVNNYWKQEVTTSYSNEVSLTGSQYSYQTLYKAYPNPTSSNLNIESRVDFKDIKLKISNVMGTIVNSNTFSLVNSKLINIDVSNLVVGTYFIQIENTGYGINQLTFIKQ